MQPSPYPFLSRLKGIDYSVRSFVRHYLRFYGLSRGHRVALGVAVKGMATGSSQEASPSGNLGEDDLGKLYEALHCVKTSYKPIGLQIGVKINEIKSVEKQETDLGDRLLEMLSIRVKKAKVLTWKDIVEALRSQCVGEGKVADEIQTKYGLAAASEGATSKEHEKQAQFNERESEKSKQSTEGDPPMNKEEVSYKQDSDSEGEGSERVKRKVHSEKPHSKAKRKGEKVKEVGKTQKRLEVVESNDENPNERKWKRRSKQKGEPPLYQEEVSYKQDSDSEGEGSERVKRKIYSEKPRRKTTRKGEKVREKVEMSVACSPEQEVELAKKKEGNVEKKESFKQGEKERGTENKLQRNKKAVREKDKNFGKETASDSHTEQEVNTQTQAVIVESDDEYFTASSGAEMESTHFQKKTKKEASPQYAKGESHLKGAMKKRRRKDKYSSAAAAGEETESVDESSYARVSKEEEGSKAQSPEPRRKPMPKVRTPKPVRTETVGSSWSKVSKRSNEKAEPSAPSSMYHSKCSRPRDRAQKVEKKDKNFGKETASDSHTEQEVNTQTQAVIVESDDEYFTASSGAEMESTQFQNKTTKEASPQYAKGESHLKGAMKKRRRKDKYSSAAAAAGEETESEDESSYARVSKEEEGSKAQSPEPRRKPMPKVRTPKPVRTETIGSSWSKVSERSNEKAEQSALSSMYHNKGSRPKDRAQKVEKEGRGIPPEKKAAVVQLELATDDRSQEEGEEWDSDERSEEEGDEDSEQEESEPGSEHNQLEKKRGRGIRSENKAAAVPLQHASDDIIEVRVWGGNGR